MKDGRPHGTGSCTKHAGDRKRHALCCDFPLFRQCTPKDAGQDARGVAVGLETCREGITVTAAPCLAPCPLLSACWAPAQSGIRCGAKTLAADPGRGDGGSRRSAVTKPSQNCVWGFRQGRLHRPLRWDERVGHSNPQHPERGLPPGNGDEDRDRISAVSKRSRRRAKTFDRRASNCYFGPSVRLRGFNKPGGYFIISLIFLASCGRDSRPGQCA